MAPYAKSFVFSMAAGQWPAKLPTTQLTARQRGSATTRHRDSDSPTARQSDNEVGVGVGKWVCLAVSLSRCRAVSLSRCFKFSTLSHLMHLGPPHIYGVGGLWFGATETTKAHMFGRHIFGHFTYSSHRRFPSPACNGTNSQLKVEWEQFPIHNSAATRHNRCMPNSIHVYEARFGFGSLRCTVTWHRFVRSSAACKLYNTDGGGFDKCLKIQSNSINV